jgi:aspartyl/asparaginyl beta-hydroxylase (cupin superfamily)
LPSIPFFDRSAMPWIELLESSWESVRDEVLLLQQDMEGFVPYVANPPGTPLNQWAELDHNGDWGAFFLWRHGVRYNDNCDRLPKTTALVERTPLLQLAGRGPNVFVSRLAPNTRIPPHNGVTNARATVHLPLVVPTGCGFRVGGETREWIPGTAWAFDDTIDHEAWNTSAEPRLILYSTSGTR